jgi:hypothetical protein
MEAMFRRVLAALRLQAVEVWHVPIGYELLISDSPAFTFRYLGEDMSVELSTAKLRWLWPTFREVICPGVSSGAVIIRFVIMLGVRS